MPDEKMTGRKGSLGNVKTGVRDGGGKSGAQDQAIRPIPQRPPVKGPDGKKDKDK